MLRAALLSLPVTVLAQSAPACDLALLLAVDISGSVDRGEYRLQMQGLADALRDGVVSEALVRGKAHLALMQWTGKTRQQITLSWSEMSDFAAVERFAQTVETAPRAWRNYSTAVGEAMVLAGEMFAQGPACRRRVMDISGDGVSNEGRSPAQPRAVLARAGVTVNALAIDTSGADLAGWYWENVITGAGAFVETADDFSEYAAAIRRKLIRETSNPLALRR